MDAIIGECEAPSGAGSRYSTIRFWARLSATQWRKLHLVHGQHHLKQLLRLRERTTRQWTERGKRGFSLELQLIADLLELGPALRLKAGARQVRQRDWSVGWSRWGRLIEWAFFSHEGRAIPPMIKSDLRRRLPSVAHYSATPPSSIFSTKCIALRCEPASEKGSSP